MAVVEHGYAVSALHRRQTVGDDDGGAARGKAFEGQLHHAFRLGIECAGGLVEQQQRPVGEDGAGNGNALPLSAGQAHAPLAEIGHGTLGQPVHELGGVGIC